MSSILSTLLKIYKKQLNLLIMRTAEICPTCATYTNAVCVLYDGPTVLTNINVDPLDSLDAALVNINTVVGEIQNNTPAKVFIASISQSDVDGPEVNYVIKNTFDDDIDFNPLGVGNYSIVSVLNEFTLNKTVISISCGSTTVPKFVGASAINSSSATLKTFNSSGVAADSLLNNDIIKIEVYS
jgi:hypothetical protein